MTDNSARKLYSQSTFNTWLKILQGFLKNVCRRLAGQETGIGKFVTLFTKPYYWALSCAVVIKYIPKPLVSLRFILLLYSHLRLLSKIVIPLKLHFKCQFVLCKLSSDTSTSSFLKPSKHVTGLRAILYYNFVYEIFQVILSSNENTEKACFYKLLHNFLGQGLITSSGKSREV